MLEIVAAGMRFVARWEEELAPQTVAAFKASLPSTTGSSTAAGAASRTGSRGATSISGSARRTRPRIRTPASSPSTPAGRARPSCSSRTATARSRRRQAICGPTTSPPDRGRGAAEGARPPHSLGRRAADLVPRALALFAHVRHAERGRARRAAVRAPALETSTSTTHRHHVRQRLEELRRHASGRRAPGA